MISCSDGSLSLVSDNSAPAVCDALSFLLLSSSVAPALRFPPAEVGPLLGAEAAFFCFLRLAPDVLRILRLFPGWTVSLDSCAASGWSAADSS